MESQLAFANGYLLRVATVAPRIAESMMLWPFEEPFSKINEANEVFNFEKDEHSWEEHLTLCRSAIDGANFGRTRLGIAEQAAAVAGLVIDTFSEHLDALQGKSSDIQVGKYRLGADTRAMQHSKIASIVQSAFAPVTLEMAAVEQRRVWLADRFDTYATMPNEALDIGQAARSFGLGALAVANPLIGVPALISSWTSGDTKSKAAAAQDRKYEDAMWGFLEQIEELRKPVVKAAADTARYITDKWMEVNVHAVMTALQETALLGHSIQHYCDSLDFDELESLEAEYKQGD